MSVSPLTSGVDPIALVDDIELRAHRRDVIAGRGRASTNGLTTQRLMVMVRWGAGDGNTELSPVPK
jgi:hypothetical protein